MRFWKVDDLIHKNEHIHYNKQYSGNVYLVDSNDVYIYPITFRLETDVFGSGVKDIKIYGDPNYPLIELKNNIKEYMKNVE